MNATIGVLVALVLLTVLGPVPPGDSDTQEGELIFNAGPSEVGIVARRVFRDSEGRIAKTLYYVLRPGVDEKADKPYTEEMLAVREVVLHTYDEQGREIRQERYSPDMELRRVAETLYDAQGSRDKVVYLNAEGVRTYETRYSGSKESTHLYFDDSGKGLVGIQGALPDDIDLVHGWGKDMHGLSCGLAANRMSGTLREIYVHATVRNRGLVADEIMGGQRMVLVDAAGQAVLRNDERPGAAGQDPAEGSGEDEAALQQIKPGTAAVVVHGELARWYSDLAAGNYSLIVVCRDSDGDYSIVSNRISLTITPDEG